MTSEGGAGELSDELSGELSGGGASEVVGEKFSVARVFDSFAVTHPQIAKQQSVNNAPSLRVMRNLLSIDAVFLDVCTSVKLC